ncbi:hypothetical protein cypCar_00028177 [Cyprinus carpio]|nr:hypothetical protein cypCar_00028177 [Cyprinus carpio]
MSRKREHRVLLMVITMVIFYLLCWLPYGIMALLATFGAPGLVTVEASIVPSILAKSSTVINPIIYIFMNKQSVPMCCLDAAKQVSLEKNGMPCKEDQTFNLQHSRMSSILFDPAELLYSRTQDGHPIEEVTQGCFPVPISGTVPAPVQESILRNAVTKPVPESERSDSPLEKEGPKFSPRSRELALAPDLIQEMVLTPDQSREMAPNPEVYPENVPGSESNTERASIP